MNGTSAPQGFRPWLLLSVVLIVGILYFAREFLIPLALATLISFLLAPLVRRLERWHFGRVGSVLTATALAFAVLGVVGYVIAGQLIDLANQLPAYKTNLREKVVALKAKPNSPLGRVTETMRDLTDEIAREEAPKTGEASRKKEEAMPVTVVATSGNALDTLVKFATPIIEPLSTAAIVIVFVIFMQLAREDLRDRMIHLVGRNRLQITTQAIDDAGSRVSRYLLAQLIVNVTYGIPIGVGLYFIGLPNAVLWGFLATLLRFVPYLGPVIAAAFPLALSLAVSTSWNIPILTAALFIGLELISNNVVEPLLYGSSTGLSPLAVIVSAVFWTWLWGTIGLLLATPLTVCIAVLGKYIPALSFLDVLLGEKPPIATEERFYQRLLAADPEEALRLAEAHVAENGLATSFDTLIVPALIQAERDFRSGALNDVNRHDLYLELRELIGGLGEVPPLSDEQAPVLCVSASNEFDELAGHMLVRLLGSIGISAKILPSKLTTGESVEAVLTASPQIVCISVLSSWSLLHATQVCKKLRERLDGSLLAVGFWGTQIEGDERRLQRLKRTHADLLFTTLAQAVAEIRAQPSLTLSGVTALEKVT